jgi:hypothetical protein
VSAIDGHNTLDAAFLALVGGLSLRPDELVQQGGRGLSVDRDLTVARPGPLNPSGIEAVAEDPLDVLGFVRKVVPNTRNAAVVRDDSATIAVNEAANERATLIRNDLFLPWL